MLYQQKVFESPGWHKKLFSTVRLAILAKPSRIGFDLNSPSSCSPAAAKYVRITCVGIRSPSAAGTQNQTVGLESTGQTAEGGYADHGIPGDQ